MRRRAAEALIEVFIRLKALFCRGRSSYRDDSSLTAANVVRLARILSLLRYPLRAQIDLPLSPKTVKLTFLPQILLDVITIGT